MLLWAEGTVSLSEISCANDLNDVINNLFPQCSSPAGICNSTANGLVGGKSGTNRNGL